MKNRKVSIIIPIFNAEKHLKYCVDSAVAQTYDDFEILLVDDGSTDNSLSLCYEYEKSNREIRVVHIENSGPSIARNKGIELAVGRYILFLDSDDFINKEALSLAVSAIEGKPAQIVMWGYKIEYYNSYNKIVLSKDVNIQKGRIFSKKMGCEGITTDYIGILGYLWNKLYDRDILLENEIRFDGNMNIYEDIHFNCRYLLNINTLISLSKTLTHYSQRTKQSLSNSFNPNMFANRKKSIVELLKLLRFWNMDEDKISALVNMILFNNIKRNFKIISLDEGLTDKSKRSEIDKICRDQTYQEVLRNTKTKNIKNIIIKLILLCKQPGFILILFKTIYRKKPGNQHA